MLQRLMKLYTADFFYEWRPFLYVGLGLYAAWKFPFKSVGFAAAPILLGCAAMIIYWRSKSRQH